MKQFFIGAAAYALIGVVTFGHAAVEAERFNQQEYAKCRAIGEKFCSTMTTLPPASGMLAGMFWPLYWSWEAWS